MNAKALIVRAQVFIENLHFVISEAEELTQNPFINCLYVWVSIPVGGMMTQKWQISEIWNLKIKLAFSLKITSEEAVWVLSLTAGFWFKSTEYKTSDRWYLSPISCGEFCLFFRCLKVWFQCDDWNDLSGVRVGLV